MGEWANFFIAEVGASAALAGLIFVGVSLNLTKILASAALPDRAFEALVFLITILVVSSLMLVPQQSLTTLGAEVLVTAIIVWLIMIRFDLNAYRKGEIQFRRHAVFNMTLNQFAMLPYAIAGIAILAQGVNGIYWLVPAILFSFFKAIMDSWVLLVEINR